MFALVGGVLDPLPCLRVDIIQIGEGSQRPECLTYITYGALNFSFLPGRRDVTSPWNKTILARETEKPRIEAHQVAFVFGDRGGEIIEPDFTRAAGHLFEGMNVTTHEGFETLAVR